ncbi:putative inorganic phosphate cotransporter isoform X2 [Cephus cinctus]|uniref:Inorganic phosphate cotransporter isoform X2 n=1 Tax=Cephus cinctus TaxID=211228 RepID=A0AAJ7BLU0_CEPCN|nr:putative inorganic phosphate cotransporter isoform X2 [Cephus cinctus]
MDKVSWPDEKRPLLSCEWRRKKTRQGYLYRGVRVQQRWVFAIMGFLAVFNAYTMRICLSLAITEMVIPLESHNYTDDTCSYSDTPSSGSSGAGTYDWDEYTQGIILSSFFWGYVITHLPGGILAEKFGGKYALSLGILSTAVFTLLTPLAVQLGDSTGLIVLRFLMGLGEGTTYPALNALLSKWTPPQERSVIGSLVFAGAQLGTVFATTTTGFIIHYFSWPPVFYVFGSIAILWFIIFTIICYNNPNEHPFVSEREKKFLHGFMKEHTHNKVPAVPWRHIMTSKPLWALIFAQIGHDWGFFTMITDLPKYMSSVLKFSIKNNGMLSSLPYLCMWLCSVLSSWLADWIIVKGYISRTNVRKLGTTIASVGPGLFIIGASYAGCDRVTVVILFTLGMTLMGAFYPGMKVNALDLSPNYSGTLMALVNGIGAFTGILTPYIVGVLTPNQTVSEWRLVFWIVLGVFIITNIVFILYASGDVQPWNSPEFLINDHEEKRRKAAGEEPQATPAKDGTQ